MYLRTRICLFLSVAVSITVAQNDATGDIEIKPPGDAQTRPIDSSIVFSCSGIGIGPSVDPMLSWIDNQGREIVDETGRRYIEQDGLQSLKLYITAIVAEDAGTYTCMGTINGNRIEEKVDLLLFKDITFEHAPSPQHPRLFDDALIECRVSGQPVPTVTWRYKGTKIQIGGRYDYESNGLRIHNITEEDNGVYQCRAEVAQEGRLEEKDIDVIVHIPPKITEELGDREGIEDQQVSITCKASGLPDPKYEFYKDNDDMPLYDTDRRDIDNDGGAIHFRPLKKEDEGDYRCQAVNDVGEAATTGFLKVIVPPLITRLENMTQTEGQSQKLLCVSAGDPPPEMSFRKVGSDRPYENGENEAGRIVVSTVAPGQLEMVINNLVPEDTSNYTCEATNIGGDDKKNGTITVHFRPRFAEDHPRLVYSWAGKVKNITCHALGEPEPVIEWYRFDKRLETNETYKIYKMGRDGALQVKIRDEDQDWIYGFYTCRAINDLGSGDIEIELAQAMVPGKPKAVEIKEESPTMIVFTILPPDNNGGVEIYGYRVEYDTKVQDFTVGEEIKIENLRPSSNYIFRFRAKNEVGVGVPLEYSHTTKDISAPYPINIISSPEGQYPYSYVLKWERPRTGGLPIREYEFFYRRVSMSNGQIDKPLEDWLKQVVQDDANQPMLFYTLEQLKPDTHYQIEVIAYNDIGPSEPNPEFVCKTAKDIYVPVVNPTDETGEPSKPSRQALGLSTGAIIGIVIAVFFIFLIIVDISCYFMNDCGVFMCLSVHLCGKRSPSAKEKAMEEGERDRLKDDDQDAEDAKENMKNEVETDEKQPLTETKEGVEEGKEADPDEVKVKEIDDEIIKDDKPAKEIEETPAAPTEQVH